MGVRFSAMLTESVPRGWSRDGVRASANHVPRALELGTTPSRAFYQFLDIDRLFSAMLSYSVLAILGLALVLGVMPTASQAASDAFGLAPAHGQILFALGLAAIVVPAHGSLSSLQAD